MNEAEVPLPIQIREARRRLGLTLAELGERLGVSYETVRRWELGGSTPDGENLIALESKLGVRALHRPAQASGPNLFTVEEAEVVKAMHDQIVDLTLVRNLAFLKRHDPEEYALVVDWANRHAEKLKRATKRGRGAS